MERIDPAGRRRERIVQRIVPGIGRHQQCEIRDPAENKQVAGRQAAAQEPDRRRQLQHRNQHEKCRKRKKEPAVLKLSVDAPDIVRRLRHQPENAERPDPAEIQNEFHDAENAPERRYEPERQIRNRRGLPDLRQGVALRQQPPRLLRADKARFGQRRDPPGFRRRFEGEAPPPAISTDQQKRDGDDHARRHGRQVKRQNLPQHQHMIQLFEHNGSSFNSGPVRSPPAPP